MMASTIAISSAIQRMQTSLKGLERENGIQNEDAHSDALAAARNLIEALEGPEEVVMRNAFEVPLPSSFNVSQAKKYNETHTYSLCVRLGVDLRLFHILVSHDGTPVSAAVLAQTTGADAVFLGG
jgi:hypothetical protein